MRNNDNSMNSGQKHKSCSTVRFPMLLIGSIAIFAVVVLLTFLFCHSLEREIYKERAAYMTESYGPASSSCGGRQS